MGRKRLLGREAILEVIHRWIIEQGLPPTVEELRGALRVGSTRTVLRYLRWLEEEGDIRRWRGARGIQPLRAPGSGIDTIPVPLVGEAPAGPLMIAEQNIEGAVRLPKEFLKPSTMRYFLLRVRGSSMNRASVPGGRIEEGDLVLVRQQSTADPGDVVVALIDGEATIKHLMRAPGYWVLKPESTKRQHQPIVVGRDFRVQGVVCRVLKKGTGIVNLTGF